MTWRSENAFIELQAGLGLFTAFTDGLSQPFQADWASC